MIHPSDLVIGSSVTLLAALAKSVLIRDLVIRSDSTLGSRNGNQGCVAQLATCPPSRDGAFRFICLQILENLLCLTAEETVFASGTAASWERKSKGNFHPRIPREPQPSLSSASNTYGETQPLAFALLTFFRFLCFPTLLLCP